MGAAGGTAIARWITRSRHVMFSSVFCGLCSVVCVHLSLSGEVDRNMHICMNGSVHCSMRARGWMNLWRYTKDWSAV